MGRAVVINRYGGPDVLELIERPDPAPAPGELLVRVEAAGVQPFDVMYRAGDMRQWAPAHFPQTLGNEFAGTVMTLGRDVAAFGVGDEVLGWTSGDGYSETIAVPAAHCVKKPPVMPWPEAGTLSASGQTASTGIEALNVRAGETVIIHAAAGGVGSMAVQIAIAAGAHVIGTASPANHPYLRALGAVPVDYHGNLPAALKRAAPDGADAALIAVAGEAAVTASLALVKDPYRIATIVYEPAADRHGVRRIGTQRSQERLAGLVALYEAGKLAVHVAAAIPLSHAAEAHRLVETGHVRGKVALIRE